jgi:hypothetical protein
MYEIFTLDLILEALHSVGIIVLYFLSLIGVVISFIVVIGALNGSYKANTKIRGTRRKWGCTGVLHFCKRKEIYEGRPDSKASDTTKV